MNRSGKWLIAALATVSLPVHAAHAVPLVATNGTHLHRFDSTNPAAVSSVAISGMAGGEVLVGIDARPVDGQLYGVGTTSRLYLLNTTTGAATPIGSPFTPALNGLSFGMDFNPVPDRTRVVSSTEKNFRINPNDANVIVDAPLNPAGNIVAAGYTNNFAGATTTTLYDIDSQDGTLLIQTNPNGGTLSEVGSLGLGTNLNENIGLEITPTNTLFATITFGKSRLYTINPTTGAAFGLGQIGDGNTSYLGVALLQPTTLRFAPETLASVQGAEGGEATLVVNRLGSREGAVSVDYTTAPASATAGDFEARSGTLTWPAEDNSARVITVPLKQDGIAEGEETFNVTLSNPVGVNAYLPDPRTAAVTVREAEKKADPVTTTTTTTTTTTPAPPPPPAPPVVRDTTRPAIGFGGSTRQRLRSVLSRGASFRITSTELCSLDAALTVSARDARRLRLPRRLATLKSALRPGAQTLRLKPGRRASARLRRLRSVPVALTGACTDAAGNRTPVSRAIRLRR